MEKIQIREIISMTVKGNRLEFSRVELKELYDALKDYFKEEDSNLSYPPGVREFNPNFLADIICKIDPAVTDNLGVDKQKPCKTEENGSSLRAAHGYVPSVVIPKERFNKIKKSAPIRTPFILDSGI